jgi:hypothetical protein
MNSVCFFLQLAPSAEEVISSETGTSCVELESELSDAGTFRRFKDFYIMYSRPFGSVLVISWLISLPLLLIGPLPFVCDSPTCLSRASDLYGSK